MQVRLADVARHAGVSVSTVSYVMNHPTRVSSALQDVVRASIEELGYVRNLSASALRSGVSSVVAMVVADMSDPYFSLVAAAVERELGERGLFMTLSSATSGSNPEQSVVRTLTAQGYRGIILAQTSMDEQPVRELLSSGIGAVLFDSPQLQIGEISSVCADDVFGASEAMEHLIDLGHREIVFINGPHWAPQAKDREAGVQKALRRKGLDAAVRLRTFGTEAWSSAEGRRVVAQILSAEGQKPTAYFCANDMIALGAVNQLTSAGYKVGDDVSVIGFDDLPIAQDLVVPLTTVLRSVDLMARGAVGLLLDAEKGEHLTVPTQLVHRQSTGPVHARAL